MLHIQRASAGSGKTYTLAKTYIKLFLGQQLEDGSFRLRRPQELRGAHSHILAVTFTNKATNEMKQRFVERLSDLSTPGIDPGKVDYMPELMREFGVSADELRTTARAALTELLNNYTDFQVSTIDSFFQTILRAFVYEADLTENYQLEIDNDFLTRLGLDSALASIRSTKNENEIGYWVRRIMRDKARKGEKWNLLQKDGGAKSALFKFVSEINRESFKRARTRLEEYFNSKENFRSAMEDAIRKCGEVTVSAGDEVKAGAREVLDWAEAKGVSSGLSANLVKQLRKILDAEPCEIPEIKTYYDGSGKSMPLTAKTLRQMQASGEADTLCGILRDMYGSYEKYIGCKIVKEEFVSSIPYLGIMRETMRCIASFREENNLVQLSEINTMLRRIISEDETPFIYERVGTFLDHFLIDEFQDTSELQWENFSPLLSESLSRDNLNLIIGDAKQSIYRFRDADSSLITTRVPATFAHVSHGDTVVENTNWRSSRQVVEFNNTLFSLLSEKLNDPVFPVDLAKIYGGVVQRPANMEREGYVEIHFTGKSAAAAISDYGEEEAATSDFEYVADMVADLVSRGYRQNEIAVLVRTNRQGAAVIDAFVDHNLKVRPDSGEPVIEFVSEESLKIVSARSVGIIVSALNLVAGGTATGSRHDGQTADTKEKFSSVDFLCDLNWYMAEHPDDDISDLFQKYFSGEAHVKSLEKIFEGMPTRALPALVEAITAYMVPESLRKSEASYIAAFQDKVLDYCDVYPADISSFLTWWDVNGPKATISSPEGMEAVSVMTIHKSKGLEFRCVIIPDINLPTSPAISGDYVEKQWVGTIPPFDSFLPPMLPIAIRPRLEKTPYKPLYVSTLNAVRADSLNTFYVGLTRAVDELYVFLPVPKKNDAKICRPVREVLEDQMLTLTGGEYTIRGGLEVDASNPQDVIFSYGCRPADPAAVRMEDAKRKREKMKARNEKEEEEPVSIGSYFVNPDLSSLKFKAEDVPLDDDDDPDPRSAGNIRHDIMQHVGVGKDVPDQLRRAVLRSVVSGIIPEQEAEMFRLEVMEQLENNQQVASWFAPGLTVYNERPLIVRGKEDSRPDRFVVSADGDAVVVDYKFGASAESRYRKQVTRYMENLKATGKYRSVRGYIWYVALRKVEEVAGG